MNSLRTGWIVSFIGCELVQRGIQRFGITANKANIWACTLFQFYITYKTGMSMYNEVFNGVVNSVATASHLNDLYGYFMYDMVYMMLDTSRPRNTTFIIHHAISCCVIDTVLELNLSSTFYQNAFCFLAEITSPLINARILLADYPRLKAVNKRVMIYSYFVARIMLFPVAIIGFMQTIDPHWTTKLSLYASFTAVYITSLNWFKTMAGF